MTDRKEVEVGFTRFWETGHSAALAKLVQQMCPASQQFVGVALVTDIEQKSVVSEVEHIVHGDSQLDDSEVRSEMSTTFLDLFTDGPADLRRQFRKFVHRELLEVSG